MFARHLEIKRMSQSAGTSSRNACISLPISSADDAALWLVLEPPNELLVGRVVLLGNDVCGERCGAGTMR
jgi:hypothetical protein